MWNPVLHIECENMTKSISQGGSPFDQEMERRVGSRSFIGF